MSNNLKNNLTGEWNVFVSYSKRDIKKVELFVTDLRAAEFTVWFDESEIVSGNRIREAINHGLRNCSNLYFRQFTQITVGFK